jgi:hypothetical protein
MSWDLWESGDALPDILNRAHRLQASVECHDRAAASWGKNLPVHGMWEVGWNTVEGRRELSGSCVKLNLDSFLICSMHRPSDWLCYRGSYINDKSKTLATFSVHECKREHFVSRILQNVWAVRVRDTTNRLSSSWPEYHKPFEHFMSGILQTVSEMWASHGERNYVFVMGYLKFRARRSLYLTAVTIE